MSFPISPETVLPGGLPLYAAHFVPGQFVDVVATSKGKGFQGPMKLHGFKGQDASHGVTLKHRSHGSMGATTSPGRVFPGKRMAGRMGTDRIHVPRLKVMKIDNVNNCIFVRGAVPGHDHTIVRVCDHFFGNKIFKTTPPPCPTYLVGQHPPLPAIMEAPITEKDPLHVAESSSQ